MTPWNSVKFVRAWAAVALCFAAEVCACRSSLSSPREFSESDNRQQRFKVCSYSLNQYIAAPVEKRFSWRIFVSALCSASTPHQHVPRSTGSTACNGYTRRPISVCTLRHCKYWHLHRGTPVSSQDVFQCLGIEARDTLIFP